MRTAIPLLLLLAACLPDRRSRPELAFSPADLPEGAVGARYRAVIQVRGNETPVCGASLTEGALPKGLMLVRENDDVVISGTPTEAGSHAFTLCVSCFGTNVSGQIGERKYTIVVR